MVVSETYSWYTKWCEPIVAALYMRDKALIRKLLSRVKGALAAEIFDDTTQEFLQYQIAYLEYQCNLVLASPNWLVQENSRLLTILGTPSDNPAIDVRRRRLLIQFLITLDRRGIRDLKRPEFDRAFTQLVVTERTTELWLYITEWAFRNQHNDLVEEAYEYALLQGKGFYASWTWQRIHIMWKLSNKTATKQDMMWIIRSAEIQRQLKSLKSSIWLRAEGQGLIDTEVRLVYNNQEKLLFKDRDERVKQLIKRRR